MGNNYLTALFINILSLLCCVSTNAQTQFYFQDFETSSGWILSHTTFSNNHNYWVWGSGTAGATTGAATYSGSGSLQLWRRSNPGWTSPYSNNTTSGYTRTASRTFDFSSIPCGSTDLIFSYYMLCNGEVGNDDFRVVVNGTVLDGPVTGVTAWTKRTINLDAYIGNANVEISLQWRNNGSIVNEPAARIDDIEITYNPATPPNAGVISGVSELCIDNTSVYTSDAVLTGTWSSSDVSVLTVNGVTGEVTAVSSGSASVIYTVEEDGCQGLSSKTVTVKPTLTNVTAGDNKMNCSGAGVVLDGFADGNEFFKVALNETFEDDSDTRGNWTQIQEVGSGSWTFDTGSSGGNVTTANNGTKNARFVSVAGTNSPRTKLVSPVIDLTFMSNIELNFWYAQERWTGDQNTLRVYYRTSDADAWVQIANYTGNISSWANVTLSLPNPSSTYQIAFEGLNNYGHANTIDDVVVSGDLIYPITYLWTPSTGLSATNVANPSANPTETTTYTMTASIGTCEAQPVEVTVLVGDVGTWFGNTSSAWEDATNWACETIPTEFIDVVIPAFAVNMPIVSNTTGPASTKNLTIENGAVLTYSSTIEGNALFIYGNLTVEGELDDWDSNFYVTLEGGRDSEDAIISGEGTMPYGLSVGYNRESYYRINNSIVVYDIIVNGANSSRFDMNGFDLTTYYCEIQPNSTFYQRDGILQIEQNLASIDDVAFVEGTGITYFSSGTNWVAGNQTIPSISYYNLKVRSNDGRTATLGNGSSFTVANDLTLINPHNAGGLIRATSASAGTSITVNGNLYIGHDGTSPVGNAFTLTLQSCRVKNNNNNGVIYMSDNDDHLINLSRESATAINFQGFVDPVFYGTVNYNRSGDQTITTATYKHLTLSNSGDKTLSGSIDVVGDLTIGTTTSLLSSTHTIDIGGDWINNGNFVANGQIVTFNGSTNQSIEGTATETNFYNLTNQKVGGELILSQDIKVTSILEMAGSDIDLNGQVIDLNGTGTINGESNSDRIKGATGYITSTIASVNAPSNLNIGGMGAVLSSPANLGTTTISRGHTRQTGINGNLGIERYYIISPTNNSGVDATLQAEYFANDVPAGYIESQFALYRSADGGATWALRDGFVNASGGEKGSVTLGGIDQFSIWTISDSQAQPLPVKMTVFLGECYDDYVSLFWQTASEQNCSHFDIERSSNGLDWSVLGDMEGNGNSTSLKNYEWKDEYPSRGSITYYRLRQVDFDGEEELFGPISLTCDGKSDELRLEVFPNPTVTNATLLFSWNKGACTGLVKVFDASGKIVQYRPITVLNGTNAISININNQPSGIYFIDLEINDAPQGMLKVLKQ
jgi:hypothetical protein